MKFNKKLSSQLSRAIKANSTTTERIMIAEKHQMSIHTLNSVINMQRNIVKTNLQSLVDILGIAIKNANKDGLTLSHYANEIKTTKAAEAAQSNETKQRAN